MWYIVSLYDRCLMCFGVVRPYQYVVFLVVSILSRCSYCCVCSVVVHIWNILYLLEYLGSQIGNIVNFISTIYTFHTVIGFCAFSKVVNKLQSLGCMHIWFESPGKEVPCVLCFRVISTKIWHHVWRTQEQRHISTSTFKIPFSKHVSM